MGRRLRVRSGAMLVRGLRAVVVALLLAGCNGRGAQALDSFGEAMRTLAMILLAIAAIGAALYLAVWARWIVTWRRGQASWAAAGTLVLVHAAALVAAGDAPDEPAYAILWWTAPLPALALGIAVASRWSVRLAVAAAIAVGLCLLPARAPRLTALPGPIVDLAFAPIHACVVIEGGEVVCAGEPAATCREPLSSYAGRLAGVKDADAVFAVYGATCVRHREGPIQCCGTGLAQAPTTGGWWPLPVGGPGATLVLTPTQVLARTGEDLRGWPHALPEGLTGARAIAGEEGIETYFAAVDRVGVLWMWRQNGAAIERLARFPGLVDAAEVAVHRRTGACVRREGGAVRCFPWPDERGGEPFDVAGLRAAQLVALDDPFDSFCAREAGGAVVCWTEDQPPRPHPDMGAATRLVSLESALCDVAGRVRCVPAWREFDGSPLELLNLQAGP